MFEVIIMPMISNETFLARVKAQTGNDYTFLEPYKGNMTDISVRHNKCGRVYKITPNRFIGKKQRCSFCYGHAHRTEKHFKEDMYSQVGSEYSLLSKYKNSTTKVKLRHNKCGYEYFVAPYSFLDGHRCPNCMKWVRARNGADLKMKSDTEYRSELKEVTGDSIISLESYKGALTKIKHKCTICGYEFCIQPNELLNHGTRCKKCNGSAGEKIINQYLESKHIKFEYPKSFPDLKDIHKLRYDFYLPDYNILIEYQGMQHIRPMNYMGGKEKFTTQQKHDEMKRKYAKDNGYVELELFFDTERGKKAIYNYLDKNLNRKVVNL